jgi:protein O-GlcNAc transferase
LNRCADAKKGLITRLQGKVLYLESRAANTYNEAGLLLASQQRFKEATEAFRAGIACNPRAFTLYHNLGNILLILGDVDQAILCIVEALKWAPRAAEIHISLGNALRVKGDLKGAQDAYSKARELDPRIEEERLRVVSPEAADVPQAAP